MHRFPMTAGFVMLCVVGLRQDAPCVVAAEAEQGGSSLTSGELAGELIETTGISKGFCSLLNVADGKLVLELGSSGDLLVHAWDADAARVAAARKLAADAGLYGKSVLVEQGKADRLPYGDNIMDLVVHLNLSADDLRGLSAAEVLRVLRPGGKAVLGRLKNSAAGEQGLTADELKRWITATQVTEPSVRDDQSATWIVLAKPIPEGLDTWSHWEHGPDNNPVSLDQRIKAPYMTQSLGQPYYIAMPAITTVAGGRTFIAMGHIAHHEREEPWLNTLMANSGYNGTTLWTRKLPDGYLVHRSAFVATDDTFYMIDTDGSGCLLLDPETGEEQGRIENAQLRGPWKWIAIQDGILYALVGGKKDPPETTIVRSKDTHWSWGELSRGYYGKNVPWGFGRNIAAIDLKTRKILWQHTEDTDIDSRGMVMGGGKMYVFVPESHIVSLDVQTGKPAWTNGDQEIRGLIEQQGRGLSSTPGFRTMHFCLYTPEALIYQGQTRMNVVAISTKDGTLLWRKKKTTSNPNAIYVDGKVLLGVGKDGSTLTVDPVSGAVGEDLQFAKRSCARLTATSDSFFCRGFPDGLTRYDRLNKKTLFNGAVRPSCNDGVIAASGLLYIGPWLCDCNLSLMGRVVLCSADSFKFDQSATEAERLERTAPDSSSVAPLETSSDDWATYRGNNARTASTSVKAPDDVNKIWQYELPAAAEPTAPVAAGGLVFVGAADGSVRALDVTSGSLEWSFLTGGPILQPPTVWQGRAYVGSGDGYIYALEAATGNLLWRFRAAPVERRIPVYGSLSSTWPVHSGVLVDNGVAYAAAGIIDYDGTYVYALDAVTGQIRWQNNSSGHLDSELRKGVSAQGALTIAHGRLWMPGGNVVSPAAYDLETGQYLAGSPGNGSPQANRGEEIGIFHDRYVILGGRLRFSARENVVDPGYFSVQAIEPASESGRPALLHRGKIPPAWNADRLVAVSGIGAVPRSYDAAEVETLATRGETRSQLKPHMVAQSLEGTDTVAVALTPNAVLAVCEQQQQRSLDSKWFVCGLDLNQGAMLWQRNLSGPALPGGIAVDRSGRILVALLDGHIACYGGKDAFEARLSAILKESGKDPKGKEQAVAMLTQYLRDAHSPAAYSYAYARLDELGIEIDRDARKRGSITRWKLLGPVPWDAENAPDKTYVSEPNVDVKQSISVGGRQLKWDDYITTDADGMIDLADLFGPLANVAVYARAEVELPETQDVLLKIGSNDGFVCWFNGREVGRFDDGRSYAPDQDVIPVTCKAGTNTILVKVTQMGSRWAFGTRLTDGDNQPARFTQPRD